MARAWFKFQAVVPANVDATNPFVLYATRAMGGPYSVWVNGQLVFAGLDDWRMLWNKPVFVLIPNYLAEPGATLEVLFALPHRVGLGYALGSMYMGSYTDLQHARDMRWLLQMGLPMAGMLMIGLTGLFSLGLWFKRRHESVHLWLFVMAVSLIASNFQFTHDIADNAAHSKWFGSLVDSATSWVFMSFFILVQRYSGYEFPKITTVLLLFTSINTIATLPIWNWQVNALLLQHYILLAVYLTVMSLVTWIAIKNRKLEVVLFCMAVWVLYLAGLHDVTYLTSQSAPDQIFIFPYGAFVLFFVAEYLLRKRYQAALAEVEDNNMQLSQKLKQREDEVVAQQKLLQEASEQAVLLAERARLSRDIHDGIGSTLTGTLINLRSKITSPAQAAEQVQLCLDDIRLVMDSIEPMQTDLTTLFASLRHRFAGAFLAAGVQADWQLDALEGLQLPDASANLHLARVMQEIITNCLKHADAQNFKVTTSVAMQVDRQTLLSIEVEDDGKDFEPLAAQTGRGLSNILQRIAYLRGELKFSSSLGVTSVFSIQLQTHHGHHLSNYLISL